MKYVIMYFVVQISEDSPPETGDPGSAGQYTGSASGCATHAPQTPHACLGLCLFILLFMYAADALLCQPNTCDQRRQPHRLSSRDCALTASIRLDVRREAGSRPPRAPCLRPAPTAATALGP